MANEGRACYLRREILTEALCDAKILDALIAELGVPGKPRVLKALSEAQKLEALFQWIETLMESPTSFWHNVNGDEILAASLFRASDLSDRAALTVFSDVRREADLAASVAMWLKQKEHDVYEEVCMGTKRVDLLGLRRAGFLRSQSAIAVELKNEYVQLKRGLDQMATFAEYSNVVYLACTPALAAEFLNEHAEARGVKHWDPGVLNRRLAEFGFGLLIVEGDAVYEELTPKRRTPSNVKLAELEDQLSRLRRF